MDILALFLDYDGTLVPFKNRPEEAIAPDDICELLKNLARSPRCELAVVSGRSIEDLKRMLPVEGLSLVGTHGLEIRFSDGRCYTWEKEKETESIIRQIKRKTIRELGYEKGLYIEDKRLTLALHYRLLPRENVKHVTKRFFKIAEEHIAKNDLEILQGTDVLEVRPKGWHKGKAVEEFFKNFLPKEKKILPIYIGDDLTDEDAFLYLKGRGITVRVLRKPSMSTSAAYYVLGLDEVQEFLHWIHSVICASKKV